MNKKILSFIMLIGLLPVLSSQENQIRVAVCPFDDSITSEGEKLKAGNTASAYFEKKFAEIGRFNVREANAIRDYLDNLTKAQLGLTDPSAMIGNSSSLKVDYLTVGTISKFGDQFEVDARTVNVNDWRIVFAHGECKNSLDEAFDDINWYVNNKFTGDYLKEREREANRPTVSVQQFKDFNQVAMGIGYSGAFAEILNSQLGSFALIWTIERKYSQALVNEKALEMAGVIENENSEGLSVRGIKYTLSGDIRVFKDLICINYSITNIADGRVVFQNFEEITSPRSLRAAAWSISLATEDVLNNRLGTFSLTSDPSGAEIFINSEPFGKTPFVKAVNRGKHKLQLKMPGYETYSGEFTIEPQKTNSLKIDLVALSQKLMIEAMNQENSGNWEGAVTAYTQFIEKYKDNAEANDAFYRKGHVLLENLKRPKEAIEVFQTLVDRYPDALTRAEGYLGLVLSLKAEGKTDQAKKVMKYLIEKYGDTSAAESAKSLSW